jgi:hypothetical protein
MTTAWTNVTAYLTNSSSVTLQFNSIDNSYASITNYVQQNKTGYWDLNNGFYPLTSIQCIRIQ